MRYTILLGDNSASKFSQKVQEKIDDGWIPQGSVHFNCGKYHQAMIKHDTVKCDCKCSKNPFEKITGSGI